MKIWRIRPSAGARIVACPGSLRVAEGAPAWIDEYNDPKIREEGTACHEFASTRLQTGVLPEIGALAANGVPADAAMLDAIYLYENAVKSLACVAIWVEHQLQISEECGGTPDIFGYQQQENGRWLIDIADLKYGFRIVNMWPNYQLVPYAIGVCKFLGLRVEDCDFRFTIVQPRRWHRAGPVRSARVSGIEVAAQFEVFDNACRIAQSPLAPLNPGEHCDYCPGRARCNALQDAAHNVGFGDANDLQPEEAERELKFLMQHRDILEARITGLAAQVEHHLRDGKGSKYFELQSTSGKLEWDESRIDQIRAIAKCMKAHIEKEPDLITPNQARRIVGDDFVNIFARRVSGAKKLVLADPSYWTKRFKG